MIRISINWDFISPSLQVMSGNLIIEDVDLTCNRISKPLIHCKIKKERGSMSYNARDNDEGMSSIFFEHFREQVDSMIQGYYSGMILEDNQYGWVADSANMSLEDWLITKDIDHSELKKSITYVSEKAEGLTKTKLRKVNI